MSHESDELNRLINEEIQARTDGPKKPFVEQALEWARRQWPQMEVTTVGMEPGVTKVMVTGPAICQDRSRCQVCLSEGSAYEMGMDYCPGDSFYKVYFHCAVCNMDYNIHGRAPIAPQR